MKAVTKIIGIKIKDKANCGKGKLNRIIRETNLNNLPPRK